MTLLRTKANGLWGFATTNAPACIVATILCVPPYRHVGEWRVSQRAPIIRAELLSHLRPRDHVFAYAPDLDRPAGRLHHLARLHERPGERRGRRAGGDRDRAGATRGVQHRRSTAGRYSG